MAIKVDTSVVFGSWKHMNVNMRDFLSSQRPVVNANREIRGVKVGAQHSLEPR